ncbi:gamma-glutamyltransferase [Porphyrobacter sp. LM 6]|uniref:gamma-glutamyltransferase n=1 Tax=Porphyrobacter sp. LM 6 TaxID=1896196 RepID=UPI0008475E5E|nr:gamma-glutamyltransferase [Porphyrobacter sp. LM 6]AOL93504.1 gamma-glutamyltransferase 1 Threonine peptidase.MEROPS family T03 [Porphyrobacter sp. LM 6]
MRFTPALLAPLALVLAACATTPSIATVDPAPSAAGAVSSADPRATAAGEAILAQGGSATDAAIAVMLALTVVEPQSSGIGGGGFMVRADGDDGALTTIDGRETAPAAATPTRFLDADGKLLGRDARVFSGLSVGVPGNIALAAKAHAAHGKLPWAKLFEPAITLAEDGFVMNRRLYESLAGNKGRADKSASAKAVFFGADGEPLPVGATVKVPALAETFRALAKLGPQAMYGADNAAALAAYVAGETPQDGRMAPADITAYAAKDRTPVCTRYRIYRICGMGPPSSGGIAVAQMLGQLERFDLAALGPNSPTFWHLFIESQRLAYADRELYSGDADFVAVPTAGLVDRNYLASRSALIDPAKRLVKAEAGVPPGAPLARGDGPEEPEHGTTHFSVVDAQGNAISYTSTIEGAFGSGLHFGGFYLNNELTDFTLTPEADGKPVANRVEGGKRPRSSMAPTIVFDEAGKVVLVIGAAGGPTIPISVARGIIGVLDFRLGAQDALDLPFAMAFGDTLLIEEGSALVAMKEDLSALGHTSIRIAPAPIKANALGRRADGTWEVATEPRMAGLVTP